MKVYDFKVLLEPDDDAGGYTLTCPTLPGCYSQGETVEEALTNIREAIELCLADMNELEQPIPDSAKTLIGTILVEA